MRRPIELYLLLLTSCAVSNPWVSQTIAAGDLAFDSTRVCFHSAEAHPVLVFEIIHTADKVEGFLSLKRFRFTANPISVQLTLNGESFQE
ncbi:MAG: hypothetical protein KGQ49_04485, partial [Verrucomicrobia bacterium]|nr:hypothetical protein [Verrucomicrobiota bacterium]